MTDKIDTPSQAYNETAPDWADARDVIGGSKTMKRAGEKHLPRLSGQTDVQYNAFKKRALFFNATSRTVQGLVGLIFRKAPVIVVPLALEQMLKTVTPQGHSIQDLLEDVVTEVVSVNYSGLLVDHPAFDPTITTAAQATLRGIRPYISIYRAESILGVDFAIVNGLRAPSRVRLLDDANTVRELVLIDGIYNIIIHTRAPGTSEFIAGEPHIPLANSSPLSFIPFLICSDEPIVSNPPRPMLGDLIDVNISHYQTSAALDHGVHWTALPTPWVTGAGDEQGELTIGASSAWVIGSDTARVGMLEYTGTGLQHLEKRAADKAEMMVLLGARILASDKNTVESEGTHAIKRAGENSILSSTARTISRQVTTAITWLAAWAQITGDVSINLNNDFVPGAMTPQALSAWVAAVQSGSVSQETFFDALKDGEAVNPDLTFADEQDRRTASAGDAPPVGVM